MKILDQIVDIINERLQDTVLTDNVFQSGQYDGLAYIVGEREGSPQKPYTWNGENIRDITLSDHVPFSIYHRCTNIDFKDSPLSGWGDGNGMIKMASTMMAVIYSNRLITGYTQEDLILMISSGLNYTLTKDDLNTSGLQSVKASVQRANNNSVSVFQGEYGMVAKNPLQPSSVYFAIQYSLEISASVDCLTCQTCN